MTSSTSSQTTCGSIQTVQDKPKPQETDGTCLKKPFAHASSGSAHQTVQAEVVIGIKLGLHDIEGALGCRIQAHVPAHVVQRQAVLAVVADV